MRSRARVTESFATDGDGLLLQLHRRPVSGKYRVGDKVFVKPPGARCTTHWGRGVVTALSSTRAVEVGGIPRHVADVRPVPVSVDTCSSDDTLPTVDEPVRTVTPRRAAEEAEAVR